MQDADVWQKNKTFTLYTASKCQPPGLQLVQSTLNMLLPVGDIDLLQYSSNLHRSAQPWSFGHQSSKLEFISCTTCYSHTTSNAATVNVFTISISKSGCYTRSLLPRRRYSAAHLSWRRECDRLRRTPAWSPPTGPRNMTIKIIKIANISNENRYVLQICSLYFKTK